MICLTFFVCFNCVLQSANQLTAQALGLKCCLSRNCNKIIVQSRNYSFILSYFHLKQLFSLIMLFTSLHLFFWVWVLLGWFLHRLHEECVALFFLHLCVGCFLVHLVMWICYLCYENLIKPIHFFLNNAVLFLKWSP